jgi:hypothetical protein
VSTKTIVKLAAGAAAVWFLFFRGKGGFFGAPSDSADKNKNPSGVVKGAA